MSTGTRRGAAVIAGSLAGAAALVTGIATAPPALADTNAIQPVQFSDDDIHWSNSYSTALFGDVLLVPGGSADRAFYVRNGASESAVLRVTLYDVTTTNTDFAAALTVSTSLPGRPGTSVPVTDARPCATLSQGQVLAAGDGIRLDNVAALADLNGTGGQASEVSFKLAISLSSTDLAAPAPNTCPTDFGNTVVGAPDPGTSGSGDSRPVYYLGASGWTTAPSTGSEPVTVPTTPVVPGQPESPAVRRLVANTERLYQENFVALWFGMAVLGALILLFVRRRQRSEDDSSEQKPYPPTTQIGTGR